jgi:hypothetical protein
VRWEAEAARLGHPSFASEGIMQVRSLLGAAGLFGLLICHDAAGGIVGPSRPSRLVTVQANAPCPGLGGSLSFNATVLSDGSTQPFSIPPGEVLVITALDWYIAGAAPLSHPLTAVEIVNSPPAGTSDPFVSVGSMDSSGNGGMTAVLQTTLWLSLELRCASARSSRHLLPRHRRQCRSALAVRAWSYTAI